MKVEGEDKAEIIMAKMYIKIDRDQTVEIDMVNQHMGVILSMGRIIKKGLSIFNIPEEILREEILEKHKTIEVTILEVDTEVALGTVSLIEVGVGLEKDNFWITLGEMI